MNDPQLEEYTEALAEKRQPICMFCKESLQRIEQTFYDYVVFEWDEKQNKYVKLVAQPSGDCDKPTHAGCENADWDFVEGNDAAVELGLSY